MKRILVTGGSGFIGTNLVEHYLRRGDNVINVDCAPPRNQEHSRIWRSVNLLAAAELDRVVGDFRPDLVFHLGARTDLQGKAAEDYEANTSGTENLVRSLRRQPPQRAVFASSMLVCRIGYRPRDEFDYCPSTPYGASKVESEAIVRRGARSFPWIIVRPTSIWGPWFGSPYRDFFVAVRRGLYVHPRRRKIRRSYGFVLNSVAQLASLAEREEAENLVGRSVYLADYHPVELQCWAEMIQQAFDARPVVQAPLSLLRVAARSGDLLQKLGWNSAPITSFRLNNLLTEVIHDTTPLQRVLPTLPFSVNEGVAITVQWMRAHPQTA